MSMIGLYMMPKGIGPKRYLNELFSHTENGILTLSHQGLYYQYPLVTECKMSWTPEDIPMLYREFQTLRDKLQEMAYNLKEPERGNQPWAAPAVRELIPEPGKLQRKAESLCISMRLQAGWKESIFREYYCEFIEELALSRFCKEKKWIKQDGEYWVELELLERVNIELYGEDDFLCAKMRTTGPKVYRVNVLDVGYDFDVKKGDLCAFRLVGNAGTGLKAYPSEEALRADGCDLPIPYIAPDSEEEPSPLNLIVGKVLSVLAGPHVGHEGKLGYGLLVETAEMTLEVGINEHDGEIHKGDLLFGYISMDGIVEKA